MFSVTTKTKYGLLAILDLSVHFGKGLVQIKDIVSRTHVPRDYIEQILSRLTKQGIVRGVRGNNGGYELGKPPEAITLLQVMEAIEGDMAIKETVNLEVLKDVFHTLESRIRESLSITLSQLVQRQREIEQQIIYQI